MLKWKYVQQGALMMFWNILDIYTIKSYFRNKYWYLPYQIAKCKFCTFALTSTTVYVGRIFRTNTIWDSTNQISNAVFISITISLVNIAWTCTWAARPHIITTYTLKNFRWKKCCNWIHFSSYKTNSRPKLELAFQY